MPSSERFKTNTHIIEVSEGWGLQEPHPPNGEGCGVKTRDPQRARDEGSSVLKGFSSRFEAWPLRAHFPPPAGLWGGRAARGALSSRGEALNFQGTRLGARSPGTIPVPVPVPIRDRSCGAGGGRRRDPRSRPRRPARTASPSSGAERRRRRLGVTFPAPFSPPACRGGPRVSQGAELNRDRRRRRAGRRRRYGCPPPPTHPARPPGSGQREPAGRQPPG